MADVNSPVSDDGVEPSILVELLDVPHNAGGAKPRSGNVIPIGVPTLVTDEELSDLGAFAYVIVEKDADEADVETANTPENKETSVLNLNPISAPKPAGESIQTLPPVNPPGQSGQ
jgi:hypothetical protein